MTRKLLALGLVLALFIGGTATSSALAATEQSIQSQEEIQGTDPDHEVQPQATPGALAAVGIGVVTGVAREAGAKAYNWAKGKVTGRWSNDADVSHDEITVIFDQ